MTLHGVLPSLAGGEWPGRCDLYTVMDGPYQREGKGLLKPSLRDVAHDGWLCTFTIHHQLEIPSARS